MWKGQCSTILSLPVVLLCFNFWWGTYNLHHLERDSQAFYNMTQESWTIITYHDVHHVLITVPPCSWAQVELPWLSIWCRKLKFSFEIARTWCVINANPLVLCCKWISSSTVMRILSLFAHVCASEVLEKYWGLSFSFKHHFFKNNIRVTFLVFYNQWILWKLQNTKRL
jgi:hypothetical protein